mgnify:CR=1 FL=1
MAYEPWETQIASKFLERRHQESPEWSHSLVIADPYQIRTNDGEKRLSKLRSRKEFTTEVVFEPLLTWQNRIRWATRKEALAAIERVETRSGLSDLDALVFSDLHLAPRERAPYYPPMSKAQALMAAALVMERVFEAFLHANPSIVVMIDEQYLVKNFVARLADKNNIPIRVFRMARYKRYVKCDHFFLPSAEERLSWAHPQESQPASQTIFDTSLYERNLSVQEKGRIRRLRVQKISSTVSILRKALTEQRRKSKSGPKSRPPEFRHALYWSSSAWRVRVYLLNQSLRLLRYVWMRYPFIEKADIRRPYVLIPLHVRPESSTLTQGPGMEDEELVKAVAEALNSRKLDLQCLVLEHPSMIQDRRMRFYRNLRKLPGVAFADPGLPTPELLGDAAGILTISGTAALEGALLDVPVHVVGFPEFLDSISSSGWNELPSFLEAVARGEGPKSGTRVSLYLKNLEDNAVQMPWSWEAVSTGQKIKETTEGLLELFDRSFADDSQKQIPRDAHR